MASIAGALLPVQAGLNTKLSKAIESPVYAATISFIVGTIGLILYILLTKQTIVWTGIKTVPFYVWIAGLMGAFYVTVIILSFPKLGPGLTFGLVVAGQMFISALLEHYNILVSEHKPINFYRILGMAMIVAGVILIRKF